MGIFRISSHQVILIPTPRPLHHQFHFTTSRTDNFTPSNNNNEHFYREPIMSPVIAPSINLFISLLNKLDQFTYFIFRILPPIGGPYPMKDKTIFFQSFLSKHIPGISLRAAMERSAIAFNRYWF